ncbi:MAG: hypothetical protein GX594_13260, partial [Pirellulaceae bacterium]|nr:hypothetical protein [Pirellulaceae bacterium]
AANPVAGVRIIGGRFRGRRIQYSGDIRTRPMKDRLREAIFNLVGPSINGKHVLDLFAGTGALALEALGRGAARATLIEIHFPTATIIRQNAALLGVEGQTQVVAADTFIWCEQHLINPLAAKPSTPKEQSRPGPGTPWAVFCSPPYEFYASRREDMLGLIGGLIGAAPAESLVVVEADARFDFALLPQAEGWRVRSYPPAQVGIFRKP